MPPLGINLDGYEREPLIVDPVLSDAEKLELTAIEKMQVIIETMQRRRRNLGRWEKLKAWFNYGVVSDRAEYEVDGQTMVAWVERPAAAQPLLLRTARLVHQADAKNSQVLEDVTTRARTDRYALFLEYPEQDGYETDLTEAGASALARDTLETVELVWNAVAAQSQ